MTRSLTNWRSCSNNIFLVVISLFGEWFPQFHQSECLFRVFLRLHDQNMRLIEIWKCGKITNLVPVVCHQTARRYPKLHTNSVSVMFTFLLSKCKELRIDLLYLIWGIDTQTAMMFSYLSISISFIGEFDFGEWYWLLHPMCAKVGTFWVNVYCVWRRHFSFTARYLKQLKSVFIPVLFITNINKRTSNFV